MFKLCDSELQRLIPHYGKDMHMAKTLVLFLLTTLLMVSCVNFSEKEGDETSVDTVVALPDTTTATLLFVGDLMQHSGRVHSWLQKKTIRSFYQSSKENRPSCNKFPIFVRYLQCF